MTKKQLFLPHSGVQLLKNPSYNKGNAFSIEERKRFNLEGLLPPKVEGLSDQLKRSYSQLCQISDPLQKHIFLRDLQDTNETLFYALVTSHITEVMPLIYTPIVGEACQQFSSIYRQPRGLFLSHQRIDDVENLIWNFPGKRIKVIVITDGERILGLGDLGTNGMGIPIGKLSLYTACGGINPAHTLPIFVDFGTNNEELLADPMYIGASHRRIEGEEYLKSMDRIMKALTTRWPNVLIQFEDFAQHNANILLERYRDKYCCFNDDIQGTAAITLGTLIKALVVAKQELIKQKIVIAGAGSAAVGIAELIAEMMSNGGISKDEAYSKIFLVNSKGLLSIKSPKQSDFQRQFIKTAADLIPFKSENPDLKEVVEQVKPGILIGVSGQANVFTEDMIRSMAANHTRPIIFPLSNPTSKAEARPEDLIKWTDGMALIATGSPFAPVSYKGNKFHISQCNNSFIFPGIGLGICSKQVRRVNGDMILSAALTLAEFESASDNGALLPNFESLPELSNKIAVNVVKRAIADNLALPDSLDRIEAKIKETYWQPVYHEYQRTSF